MPAKNALKVYVENSFYHLYNRGVEKRNIFQEKQDYSVFLSYLKTYLSPLPKDEPLRRLQNYANQIDLLTYCLMKNHFHLLIKQHTKDGINYFMHSLGTKYVAFFNKKYDRVGPLFQGRYKAVRVQTNEQLLYLTKYIHRNPIELITARTVLADYPYSSYRNYLGEINQTWVKPEHILKYYSSTNPPLLYKAFVEETDVDPSLVGRLMIDENARTVPV